MNDQAQGIDLADALRDFASRITPENIVRPEVQELVDIIDAFGKGDFRRVQYLIGWRSLFHSSVN